MASERSSAAVVPACPATPSVPVMEHAAAIADAIEDIKASLRRCNTRLTSCESRACCNATDIATLRDTSLACFEETLKSTTAKVNQLVKKYAELSERLAALEEVVEDMDAEEETTDDEMDGTKAPEPAPRTSK